MKEEIAAVWVGNSLGGEAEGKYRGRRREEG